jgi:hypothetical protein
MTDDVRDDNRLRAERRAFLEKCGRFSVVTPPSVTLMLAVSTAPRLYHHRQTLGRTDPIEIQ